VTDWFLTPIVQYGFLGFSGVLLGILVWLIRRLLSVLERNTEVIANSISTTDNLTHMVAELLTLNRTVHEKLISRPCIARHEA